MGNLEGLWIWQEADLYGQLPWYRQVSANRMPAKFQIAQHIPEESPTSRRPPDHVPIWSISAKS
ncbi:MAG: hypothetical protein HY731_10625 [Candidatus Tectomicrobia bacterium]|nr:hypothetical protein [Candidatus Tectomicrobia bacterium]